MKYLYFADDSGVVAKEARNIQDILQMELHKKIKMKWTVCPDFDGDNTFDVLFFDWGGMSLGNSMLQHFSSRIINHAREHPDRLYVMTSKMTAYAMKEMQSEMALEHEEFKNVFLSVESALPLICEWEKEKKQKCQREMS
jgi:hypothetical protein